MYWWSTFLKHRVVSRFGGNRTPAGEENDLCNVFSAGGEQLPCSYRVCNQSRGGRRGKRWGEAAEIWEAKWLPQGCTPSQSWESLHQTGFFLPQGFPEVMPKPMSVLLRLSESPFSFIFPIPLASPYSLQQIFHMRWRKSQCNKGAPTPRAVPNTTTTPPGPLLPGGGGQRETSYGCNSRVSPCHDARDARMHSKPAVAIPAAANHPTGPEEKAKKVIGLHVCSGNMGIHNADIFTSLIKISKVNWRAKIKKVIIYMYVQFIT